MNAKIKEFSNELEVDQNKYKYFPNKLKFYSEEEKKNIIPYLRKKRLLSMLNKVKIHKQGVETPKKNIEIQPIEIENIVEISNKSSEKISEKLKSLKISESPDYTEKNSAIFINESISHKAFSSPLKSKSSSRNLFESFLTPNNNKIIKNLNFKISKIKENEKPINKNPQKKIKFNKETNLFNILLERKANIFNQLNKSPIKKDPEKKNIEIVKNSKIKNNLSKYEIEGITKKKLVLLQLKSEIEAISLENSLSDISIEKERKNKKITKFLFFKKIKIFLFKKGKVQRIKRFIN